MDETPLRKKAEERKEGEKVGGVWDWKVEWKQDQEQDREDKINHI